MSLKDVKAFYEMLATDQVFRTKIQQVKSKEECSQLVKSAGYDFTQKEFEDYTAKLLQSTDAEEDLKDLTEKELIAILGGGAEPVMTYGLPPIPENAC